MFNKKEMSNLYIYSREDGHQISMVEVLLEEAAPYRKSFEDQGFEVRETRGTPVPAYAKPIRKLA